MSSIKDAKGAGFTLVELLVVVAVTALLIALLLPALEQAKRQARVITCATNQRQIGIGLMTYFIDWDAYPPPSSMSVYIVYTTEIPGNPDNRQALLDIASGASKDIYFCPLYGGARPEDSLVGSQYSDHFFVHNNTRHYVGYAMMFLYKEYSFATFDFSQSGNPKGDRPTPGDASSAVVSDVNWDSDSPGWDGWIGGSFNWRRPRLSSHNSVYLGGTAGSFTVSGYFPPPPFQESNVLYGDGHVVTRAVLENYVLRGVDDYLGY